MVQTEIRQKLHQQIDQLPSDLLVLVSDFLEFVMFKRAKANKPADVSPVLEAEAGEPILRGSTGADLVQFVGAWQGDDFETCLQAVYKTRSPAEF